MLSADENYLAKVPGQPASEKREDAWFDPGFKGELQAKPIHANAGALHWLPCWTPFLDVWQK